MLVLVNGNNCLQVFGVGTEHPFVVSCVIHTWHVNTQELQILYSFKINHSQTKL